MPLLTINNLTKNFAGLVAVSDVSFDIEEGEITALIGPNGAGKTTLLNMVAGNLAPNSGRMEFAGRSIDNLAPAQISRFGIVRTFQRTSVFPDSSVLENVLIGSHLMTRLNLLAVMLGRTAKRREEEKVHAWAGEIVEFVGLSGQETKLASDLPYGDQRRLGVAIALAARPRLLMLDEPAAGMTASDMQQLMALIRRIRERGITVLLVEHNMRMVMNLCGRIVVLDHGEKIADGPPDKIIADERVIDVYLGKEAAHAAN